MAELDLVLQSSTEVFKDSQPPEPVFSDYLEMCYLVVVILIGLPLNVHIFVNLLFQLRKTPKNSVKRSFLLLKINLNISDLLIIMVQAVGKLLWLLTYEWKGGELICRLFNFLTMFTLYLSSNIIVCIAFDRLRTVLAANKLRQKSQSQVTTCLITSAWILAIVLSLPQLYVWRTFNAFPELQSGWFQCTDIWLIRNHEKQINSIVEDKFPYNEFSQKFYNISHLILVFYGPLFLLLITYGIIALNLMQYSISDPHFSSHNNGVCSVLKPTKEGTGNEALRHGPIEPDDASHMSTTRSLMELNPRSNDFLHAQPRHSTISAYNMRRPRHSEDIESTVIGPELSTLNEIHEELDQQKKTLISALRDFKNEFRYCGCANGGAQKERPSCAETESMVRSASQVLSSSPPPGLNARASETVPVLYHGGSMESSHIDFPSRSHSAISGAFRRIRRRRKSSAPNNARLPAWRRQLRSRMFRTTLAIIIAHILFWLPYNVFALTRYANIELYERLNVEANIFKELQILIVIVNPFLYGFANGP